MADIICAICKDPHHSMSLLKREEILELRKNKSLRVTPLLPEEYHDPYFFNRPKDE